jgi:acyl dehydratase
VLARSGFAAPPLPRAPARPGGAKPQRQLTRSFYWSELRVGDDLPQLTKPAIDRLQIARYAGAAGDFNRLQLDEPFAHALGFRSTFAPGALAMGLVGQLLTNWLKRGHVRRLAARFVKIIWPGDELTCRGRVSELRKEKGACYADLELWAENQKGELVLRGQASCELYETPGSAPSAVGAPFSGARAGAPSVGAKPQPRRK